MDEEQKQHYSTTDWCKVQTTLAMYPGFKEWVQETGLYKVIQFRSHNRRATGENESAKEIIEGYEDGQKIFSLELNSELKPIYEVGDLPLALIENFFDNSPFKNTTKTTPSSIIYSEQKQLSYDANKNKPS